MPKKQKQHRFYTVICCVIAMVLLSTALPFVASATIIHVDAASTVGNPYPTGTWGIYNSYLVEYQDDADIAYLKFNATAGDRLAVLVTEKSIVPSRNNCEVKVTGPSGSPPPWYTDQIVYYNGNSLFPYYILRIDASKTGSYEIEIKRTSNIGDYGNLTVSFEPRMASTTTTISVPGTASNPGNSGLSLNGVNSSVISVNLTSNSAIPNDAVVKSIETTGTQTPSQGNVRHHLKPNSSASWFESTVSSNSSGKYNISIANGFAVKQNWEFRYNAMATAASTMKSVNLKITYEYDKTIGMYY